MSETNKTEAGAEKQPAAKTEETKKKQVDLAKVLGNKKLMLVGPNLVCNAGGITFSLIPDDKGANIAIQTIPTNLSPLAYADIQSYLNKGILALCDDYSDKEVVKMTTVKVEAANDPNTVEDLTLYDQLLTLEIKSLEKELNLQQKENKKPKEWFEGLLREERYSGKRESYLELISKFA